MKPILQALLLCDRVYQDRSGKFIIVGVFNQWFYKLRDTLEKPGSVKSPSEIQEIGTPWAYFSLTDIKGPTNLELRFERLSGAEVYFTVEIEVNSPDPLQSVQFGIPVPKLPSKSGNYILELLHDNVSLGSHRVTITELTKDASD